MACTSIDSPIKSSVRKRKWVSGDVTRFVGLATNYSDEA